MTVQATFQLRHIIDTALSGYTSFTHTDGSTKYYYDYPVITDKDYGGLEWHYASGGKQSPFSVVLPVFDDSSGSVDSRFTFRTLLDSSDRVYTTNNGWVIRGGDEIEIRCKSDSDVVYCSVYNGVVLEVEPLVGEDRERVLHISGVSYGDFWLYGRAFERDYRTTAPQASQVVYDILTKAAKYFSFLDAAGMKALFESLGDPTLNNPFVGKEFIGSYCGKALQEIMTMCNMEFQVMANKLVKIIPVGYAGYPATNPLTESYIIGNPKFKWSDEEYHYDTVIVSASAPFTGPTIATPTGDSYCTNNKYWEVRSLPGGLPGTDVYQGFLEAGTVVSGCFSGCLLGWRPYQNNGTYYSDVCVTLRSPAIPTTDTQSTTVQGTPFAGGAWTGLGYVEADWDTLHFGLQNNFDLSTFKIQLSTGLNGYKGYWLTNNLVNDPSWVPSKGMHKEWTIRLPSYAAAHPDEVDTSFWASDVDLRTDTTVPRTIDEIQFIMQATNGNTSNITFDISKPTLISYLHIDGTPKNTQSKTSPRPVPRQLVLLDRTITSKTDAQTMAAAELLRVQNTTLTGSVAVDPAFVYAGAGNTAYSSNNFMYVRPGNNITLTLPYYGLNSIDRRVDHVANSVVNNYWIAQIGFGTFNTTSVEDIYALRKDLLKASQDAVSKNTTSTKAPQSVSRNGYTRPTYTGDKKNYTPNRRMMRK